MEVAAPLPACGQDVWETAFDMARSVREKGQAVPSSDILIFACVRFHKARLIHADKQPGWLETHVRVR
jgi:hypothetical protein